jgi:hypothetical protein
MASRNGHPRKQHNIHTVVSSSEEEEDGKYSGEGTAGSPRRDRQSAVRQNHRSRSPVPSRLLGGRTRSTDRYEGGGAGGPAPSPEPPQSRKGRSGTRRRSRTRSRSHDRRPRSRKRSRSHDRRHRESDRSPSRRSREWSQRSRRRSSEWSYGTARRRSSSGGRGRGGSESQRTPPGKRRRSFAFYPSHALTRTHSYTHMDAHTHRRSYSPKARGPGTPKLSKEDLERSFSTHKERPLHERAVRNHISKANTKDLQARQETRSLSKGPSQSVEGRRLSFGVGSAAELHAPPTKKATPESDRKTWLEKPDTDKVSLSIGKIIECKARDCEANSLNLLEVWATRVLMRDKRDISKDVLGEYISGAKRNYARTGALYLHGARVCVGCFRRCTGITQWAWRSLGNEGDAGGTSQSAQAKDGKVTSEGMAMRIFVRNFATKFGCHMPDDGKIQIPVSTLTEFHDVYARASVRRELGRVPQEGMAKYMLTQQIAMQYRSFCNVILNEFPYLHISKHKRFTKCTACSRLDAILHGKSSQVSNSAREKARDDKTLHHAVIGRERETYYEHHVEACECDGVWSLIIDKMDQKKTDFPYLRRDTKETENACRLKVCITGVVIHGVNSRNSDEEMEDHESGRKGGVRRLAYWYMDEFMKDCNIVIHTLNSAIRKMKIAESRVPVKDRILYVQLDNASSENKNKYMFGYLGHLVHIGLLGEVRASFLPVGHTHEDVDAFFSYISKAFGGSMVVRTLGQFEELIRTCLKAKKLNDAEVHHVKTVVELKRLFKDVKVQDIRKDEFYCFKFIKNDKGEVELLKRRYMQKMDRGKDPWMRDEVYNLSSVELPQRLLYAPRAPLPIALIKHAFKGPFAAVLGREALEVNLRMLDEVQEGYTALCQTCCELRLGINEQQLVEVKEKDLKEKPPRREGHKSMATLVKEYYAHMDGGEGGGGEVNAHSSPWSLKTLLGMDEDVLQEQVDEVDAEAVLQEADDDETVIRELEEKGRGADNLGRGGEANEAKEALRLYKGRWQDPPGLPQVGKMAMVKTDDSWWVAEVIQVFEDEEEVNLRWYGSTAVDNNHTALLKGKYKKAWRSDGSGDYTNYGEEKPKKLKKKGRKGALEGWEEYVQEGVSVQTLGAHSFALNKGGGLPAEVQNLFTFCEAEEGGEMDEGGVGELMV